MPGGGLADGARLGVDSFPVESPLLGAPSWPPAAVQPRSSEASHPSHVSLLSVSLLTHR